METEEEFEAPDLFVTLVNNIWHSIFFNVEVNIGNQQIYNSNGLHTHKSYFYHKFKGALSEYKTVLFCEEEDYEEFPDEFIEAPLSEFFFHKENENA